MVRPWDLGTWVLYKEGFKFMSRAALLPFPGDPFLLNYWLKFFDEVWGEEVDKLYIGFNSPIEDCALDYIRQLCADRSKIVLHVVRQQADHGPTINALLDLVTEEYVMLVEDDGFIFRKGIVDKAFSYLESREFEIVGSKRGSCSFEILKKAQEVWGLDYEGVGDQGPNFWPNFFFSSKELLLKTDRHFGAKAWNKGEHIASLGLNVQEEIANGDTFVNTSLQLRSMIPEAKIKYLPQYHGHPEDLRHHQESVYLFDGNAPWTHVGSLSSGINGLLKDGNDRELAQRKTREPKDKTELPVQYCQSEMEHKEFERRVQWWKSAIEYFTKTTDVESISSEFREFSNLYAQAVDQLISQFGLSRKSIERRQLVYKELMQI